MSCQNDQEKLEIVMASPIKEQFINFEKESDSESRCQGVIKGNIKNKENFFYCTSFGNIKGLLTINRSLILFDPDISSEENKKLIDKMRMI